MEGAATARLEALLVEAQAHVVRAVVEEGIAGPLACLAFEFVGVEDLPFPSHVGGLSEAQRVALVTQHGPDRIWSSGDWPHWDFLPIPAEAVYAQAELVAADLAEAGCEHAEGSFLCELAYRMSRLDWQECGVVAAPDVACWAVEHDTPRGWAHETFRVTARPEIVAAYESAGWLSAGSSAGLETVLRGAGASDAQAREIVSAMSDLFDTSEIFEWLGDPLINPEELDLPDAERRETLTPFEVVRMGRADAVLAAIREEFEP